MCIRDRDGVEAITFIDEQEFDLVLMDITMPNMGGIEALKIIKEKKAKLPVVMCSAMAQEAMVVEDVYKRQMYSCSVTRIRFYCLYTV